MNIVAGTAVNESLTKPVAPPAPEPKKFLSKKERIAKKEEERRLRQQQERESTLMGQLIVLEVDDYKENLHNNRRNRSAEKKVFDLEL